MSDEGKRLLSEVLSDIDRRRAFEDGLSDLKIRHHPPGNESESWQKCFKLAERYDRGMCEGYREQIDTLLVFAGLFSAVVTAFTVESYGWLDSGPDDASVLLLAQIASALNGAVSPTAVPRPSTSALSDAVSTRINIYWFLSLTLSLSAALVAILAKQWIREYDRDAGRTHPESLGVRQMKFDGLEAWNVSAIVSSVPLLLQMALALFFVGVIDLLWHLNPIVAVPVTSVAVLVLVFYLVTTLLPTFGFLGWYLTPGSMTPQCPYKSPQAWCVLRGFLALIATFSSRKHCEPAKGFESAPFAEQERRRFEGAVAAIRQARSWMTLDLAWTALSDTETAPDRPEYRFKALAWLTRSLDHPDLPAFIWHCLQRTTSVAGLTHRSSANILSCMPLAQDDHRPEYTNMPCMSQLSPLGRAHFQLLDYARLASLPRDTAVDLLCRIFVKSSWRFDENDYSAFADLVSTIPMGNIPVPDDVCDSLFRVVYLMITRNPSSSPVGDRMIATLGWLLSFSPPSQHRTRLYLAMCELARIWLVADGECLSDGDRRLRLERCTQVLDSSMWAVGVSDSLRSQHVEESPPYNTTTLVLAELAKAIDDAWWQLRSCGIASPDPDARIEGFRALVDVATSRMEMAVEVPAQAPNFTASDTPNKTPGGSTSVTA